MPAVDGFADVDSGVEAAAGALTVLGVLDFSFLLEVLEPSLLLGVLEVLLGSAFRESVR